MVRGSLPNGSSQVVGLAATVGWREGRLLGRGGVSGPRREAHSWARAVHRSRLGGDLTFTETRVNPPLGDANSAWGASAGLNVLVYLRP